MYVQYVSYLILSFIVITIQAILQKPHSADMQKDNILNKREMNLRHRLRYRHEELHKV